jgi:hypothetical protein
MRIIRDYRCTRCGRETEHASSSDIPMAVDNLPCDETACHEMGGRRYAVHSPVPPAMWGCREHWFKLPKPLRDAIWREYVPGQEITKTPSQRYIATAAIVQAWIAGKVTVNRDGSLVVHEDIPVRGLSEQQDEQPEKRRSTNAELRQSKLER